MYPLMLMGQCRHRFIRCSCVGGCRCIRTRKRSFLVLCVELWRVNQSHLCVPVLLCFNVVALFCRLFTSQPVSSQFSSSNSRHAHTHTSAAKEIALNFTGMSQRARRRHLVIKTGISTVFARYRSHIIPLFRF